MKSTPLVLAAAVAIISACGKTPATSKLAGINDVQSITARADGDFDVFCKNGVHQIANQDQISSNRICLVTPAHPLNILSMQLRVDGLYDVICVNQAHLIESSDDIRTTDVCNAAGTPATVCSGSPASAATLLTRFPPASASIILAEVTLTALKRDCQRITGCRPWEASSTVPLFSSNDLVRTISLPVGANATLSASMALEVSSPGRVTIAAAGSSLSGFSVPILRTENWYVNVGSSNDVDAPRVLITDHCLGVASNIGSVSGENGLYTQYQLFAYGSF